MNESPINHRNGRNAASRDRLHNHHPHVVLPIESQLRKLIHQSAEASSEKGASPYFTARWAIELRLGNFHGRPFFFESE
jgi:ABC-type spermidine/putrescine transport system permease subunit I